MNTRSGGPPVPSPQTVLKNSQSKTRKHKKNDNTTMDNGSDDTTGTGPTGSQVNDQQGDLNLPQIIQAQSVTLSELTKAMTFVMNRIEAEDNYYENNSDADTNEEEHGDELVQDLIAGLDSAESKQPHSGEDSDSIIIIDDLLDETNEISDCATPLNEKVAKSFNRIPAQQVHTTTTDRIKENFKVPENCKNLGVPKVNREVWSHMSSKAKQVDGTYQSSQRNLSRALVGQARLADVLYQMAATKKLSKEEILKIFVPLMDVATCVGMSMRECSIKRRSALKVSHPPVANMCTSTVPITEYLFGDNFDTDLKSVNTAAKHMKPSSRTRGRGFTDNRFQPYTKSHSSENKDGGDRNQHQSNFRGGPSRGRGGSRKPRGFRNSFNRQ